MKKSNSPHALVLRDVEKPVPNDNELLVIIHAVSVNAGDNRSMKMGNVPKRKILGSDKAGRVESVGKNIRQFAIWDEVFGNFSACGLGGFTEYIAVPETPLALKPASISFKTAAAAPMSAVTALQGLRNIGNIQSGQKVLISGAGGGVGTFAVQIAKYYGAEVTAVCSTGKVELMRSLGADYVVDYSQEDL